MAPSEPMHGTTAISDTLHYTMAHSEPLHQNSVVPSLQPILAQQIEPNQVQEWTSQSLANSVLLQYFTLVSYVLGKVDKLKCYQKRKIPNQHKHTETIRDANYKKKTAT